MFLAGSYAKTGCLLFSPYNYRGKSHRLLSLSKLYYLVLSQDAAYKYVYIIDDFITAVSPGNLRIA